MIRAKFAFTLKNASRNNAAFQNKQFKQKFKTQGTS